MRYAGVFRASDTRVSRDFLCLFKQTYLRFRPTPCWTSFTFLDPPTSPSATHSVFSHLRLNLLPLQNLASHNLVSQRQSVVVLTVKMVD